MIKSFALIACLAALTACESAPASPPGCSSQDAKSTFDQILDENMTKNIKSLHPTDWTEPAHELTAIITTEETSHKTSCKATLKFGSNSLPVTYTTERTDDGTPYVTVFGLDMNTLFFAGYTPK